MKVSIIVPVYNAEKYLDRTIANILEQIFSDFELILIDDGSKDTSGEICDKWGKKDSRIKVIHQDNTGVGGARNAGLAVAQGEYIGFVDNDDLIHPQMYEILISIAEKENADIVMSTERIAYDYNSIIFPYYNVNEIKYYQISTDKMFERLYSVGSKDGPYMSVWNKIYRTSCVKDAVFPLFGSEDLVFNSRIFGMNKHFILIDDTISLYFWMQNEKSQFHNLSSGYKANVLKSYFQMADELDSVFPEFSHYAKEKAMKIVLSTRYNFRKTKFKAQINDDIRKNFRALKKSFIRDNRIRLSHKLGLLGFYYLPFTYSLFRKVNG